MATHSGPDLCHAEMIIPVFDLQQRLSASFSLIRRPSVRVQNSSRLSAIAGTLTTLAGCFSPKKYKILCVDRSTEIKVAVS